MKHSSSFAALVTVALIGIAAETARSDNTTPGEISAPALQAPMPLTAPAPRWYPPPPPPSRGWYAQPWRQPPPWPARPQGYGQYPPRYPAGGQSQGSPVAPAITEHPLSAELKQTQKQLKAYRTDLDKALATLEQLQIRLQQSLESEQALNENVAAVSREQQALQARVAEMTAALNATTAALERDRQQIATDRKQTRALTAERDRLRDDLDSRNAQLASLQAELQAATEGLQRARSETATSAGELSQAKVQAETIKSELADIRARLESQRTTQLNTEKTLTEERDRLRSDLSGRGEKLAALRNELQAATEALQQEKSNATVSADQGLAEARTQAEALNKELTELKAELESQSTTLQDTAKTLTGVIAERDKLQADLLDRNRELAQAQVALTATQSEMEELRRASSATAKVVVAPLTGDELDVDTVEVAALQTAIPDTDGDGVADSADLCRDSQPGVTVESTGCVAGVPIDLEGVNFRYNSHELTAKAQRILDRVADTLSRHTDLRLQVAGHTDAQGDSAYNQWLSLQRAEAVRDYLVAQGVNPDHIGAVGYGGQRPIADNKTIEGLRMNRRVELHSLK